VSSSPALVARLPQVASPAHKRRTARECGTWWGQEKCARRAQPTPPPTPPPTPTPLEPRPPRRVGRVGASSVFWSQCRINQCRSVDADCRGGAFHPSPTRLNQQRTRACAPTAFNRFEKLRRLGRASHGWGVDVGLSVREGRVGVDVCQQSPWFEVFRFGSQPPPLVQARRL